MVMEVVNVNYKNDFVGAASFNTDTGVGAFQYDEKFVKTGIELSPLKMPLSNQVYTFPGLNFDTFKGLPGMLADSLPDDFGSAVMNAWIAGQGRSPDDITPLQRLQYIGKCGMGALEFAPASQVRHLNAAQQVEIQGLVDIVQGVLDASGAFEVALNPKGRAGHEGILALLSVGMSAGGARPKAVLAFNDDFTKVRSGQANVPPGFTRYLMKFDGVYEHSAGRETFADPMGFGAMEYVYHLMATQCGIRMMPCRLLDEGARRHFITQRFDRVGDKKIHVQTLNGMAHVDFKKPGSFSYAELFAVARELKLSANDAEQIIARMVFNIVARNHDDHSKNFAFMMQGKDWSLAPAYDLAYSYKPGSPWVNSHWMSLNGKRDDFVRDDFFSLEKLGTFFSRHKINDVIDRTLECVSKWPSLASEYGVPKLLADEVELNLRLYL